MTEDVDGLINPATKIGALTALLSAIGTLGLRWWTTRHKARSKQRIAARHAEVREEDAATELREELRREVKRLRDERTADRKQWDEERLRLCERIEVLETACREAGIAIPL